jgi:integrase
MLREDELIGLKWDALDGETFWVRGKGNKRRAVPIVDVGTWSFLEAYTNALSIPLEQRFHGHLFRQLDHEDRPITRHTVEHLMLALKRHFSTEAAIAARSGKLSEARSYENLGKKLHSSRGSSPALAASSAFGRRARYSPTSGPLSKALRGWPMSSASTMSASAAI